MRIKCQWVYYDATQVSVAPQTYNISIQSFNVKSSFEKYIFLKLMTTLDNCLKKATRQDSVDFLNGVNLNVLIVY